MSAGSAGEAIWNEVECGAYTADLPLWEELAGESGNPILELGCGTGRVVTHLAEATGGQVIGLDRDEEVVTVIWERLLGGKGGTAAAAELGDVRSFDIDAEFQLVLAPMQLIQLLGGRVDRIRCLACVADHLAPEGRAALTLVEDIPSIAAEEAAPPLPDVREVDGCVYSSLPFAPEVGEETIVLRRLRQTVGPEGMLSEELNAIELQRLSTTTLEQEALAVGLQPLGRRQVPATEAHVGSTVALLGKAA